MRLRDHPEDAPKYSNSEELVRAQFLVPRDWDEANNVELTVSRNRGSLEVLGLTIAPTLACNFGCKYCFERQLPKHTMDDRTEDRLLEFVKARSQSAELLEITWFGGEPLLALHRIESICHRIHREVGIATNSQVITNGYLLSTPTIVSLRNLGITSYQITLDGLAKTHNARRPLLNGAGTFETIIRNIENLLNLDDKASVVVRVNVDSNNEREYHLIHDHLHRRISNPRVLVYPGFVDNYTFACKSASLCALDRDTRANFYLDQYYKYGIHDAKLYSAATYRNCMARHTNSFVVGPRGELYKCLAALGVPQMSIGNVNNPGPSITNRELLGRFLQGNDYLKDPACRECTLFPACEGGCPYLDLKGELLAEPHDACHVAKGHLAAFLDAHIDFRMNDADRIHPQATTNLVPARPTRKPEPTRSAEASA